MKKLVITITVYLFCASQSAQYPEGKVVVDQLYSAALENPGGEDPTRRITVYLPPGYEESEKRYPVIYYLHGFTWSDSLQIAVTKFNKLLDQAIATGKIKPVIVAMPDQHTLYRGSLYTNSTLTGNWADFTSKDLVAYMDKKYRTLAQKESRGISGHSMGGYGAIKMGMENPEVFSSIYSLSGAFDLVKELGINGASYKRIQEIDTRKELVTGYSEFLPNWLIALGRAFSPNQNDPPFYANLPYNYQGDTVVINKEALTLWNENMLHNMADRYFDNLQQLKAIKLDWGRNDDFDFVKLGCRKLSQKLENMGVAHYAEEYIGTHGNKLWSDDGRALNDMLPFFDTHLEFERN